ncbi:hypothetical protein SUGI_0581170 [Cryptomeria japonica]|nr:hypothetical protein SUGI_0581170 [Cryptomeria japonica]
MGKLQRAGKDLQKMDEDAEDGSHGDCEKIDTCPSIDLTKEVEIDIELMRNQAIICRIVGKRRTRDRNKVLQGGVWMVEDCPLYIQLWTMNLNPVNCSPYDTPIWIRLYNLPIKFWNEECLDKIGRSLSTLMEVDEDISDGDLYIFARMKIAVVRKVPRKICLYVNGCPWSHDIEVEKNKMFCLKCRPRDHCKLDCKTEVCNNTRWTPKRNGVKDRTKSRMEVNLVTEIKGKDVFSGSTSGLCPNKELAGVGQKDPPISSPKEIAKEVVEEMNVVGLKLENLIDPLQEGIPCTSDSRRMYSKVDSVEDVLDIVDRRCLSQSATSQIGISKKMRGKKTNKKKMEDEALEKGCLSISSFLKLSKGVKNSLGGK